MCVNAIGMHISRQPILGFVHLVTFDQGGPLEHYSIRPGNKGSWVVAGTSSRTFTTILRKGAAEDERRWIGTGR
jgi:hypothetical protein